MSDPRIVGIVVWALMIVGWWLVRRPYRRRARRMGAADDRKSPVERTLLGLTIVGLVVLPVVWIATGWPEALDRAQPWWSVVLGTLAAALFVWLFRRSHKDLGRNWSVSLEIREEHALVTQGVYERMRHPMYASFFLWGIAQALLVANWLAGLAGLASIALLYAGRIRAEERMMRDTFGTAYEEYAASTRALLPIRRV